MGCIDSQLQECIKVPLEGGTWDCSFPTLALAFLVFSHCCLNSSRPLVHVVLALLKDLLP